MKPLHFKIWILMLITSGSVLAQKKIIYSESFLANIQTTVVLNLENTTVGIEISNDDKVHFDYAIEFNNYSKKDIQSFIDEINVEATKSENTITLKASSFSNISKTAFTLDAPFGLTLDDDTFGSGSTNDTINRKLKDDLLREISSTEDNNVLLRKFKMLDENGVKTAIDYDKVKMYKSAFIIKIPEYSKIKIIGNQAQITFLDDLKNEIHLNLKKGLLKGKLLIHSNNKFQIDQASFNFEALSGGDFALVNVTNGKIGALQHTNITSEFSKIEIGEIQENVTITDFNGEYYFYNWAKTFGRFNFISEYTKLFLFFPEKYDYSLSLTGNNTVNHFGNISVTMSPSKTKEKFNMMEHKAKGESYFSGEINMDMVRGILYTSKQSFIKIKR